MVRLLVAVALVTTFFAGWVIGGLRRPAGPDPALVSQLEQQVATLQARLRVREDLAARATAQGTASSGTSGGAGSPASVNAGSSLAGAARVDRAPSTSTSATAPTADAGRSAPAVTPSVQAALDRVYR